MYRKAPKPTYVQPPVYIQQPQIMQKPLYQAPPAYIQAPLMQAPPAYIPSTPSQSSKPMYSFMKSPPAAKAQTPKLL